jgi:hypothetical protein
MANLVDRPQFIVHSLTLFRCELLTSDYLLLWTVDYWLWTKIWEI